MAKASTRKVVKGRTAGSKTSLLTEEEQTIVLEDGAGNYYELPRATLERARVRKSRKGAVAAALRDVPSQFAYIAMPTIPGSVATGHFEGAKQLHYAGFYLKRKRRKR